MQTEPQTPTRVLAPASRFHWMSRADLILNVLSVLWLEEELRERAGATHWPLQNLVMASDANEKQRSRGMLGGDPFNAPRSPLLCPPRGPETNRVSQLKMKKTQELMADGSSVSVASSILQLVNTKGTRVLGLHYSWRLKSIKKTK